MDWIQIYAIVVISLSALLNANQHGKPRKGNQHFFDFFIGFILLLPVYGRIFGWW